MKVAAVSLFVAVFLLSYVSGHMHHTLEPKQELRYSPEVWTYALSATLLISAAPVFILLLIPVHNAAQNKALLRILLAFAMGGLLGDVFLHLLPHAFSGAHDHHEHVHEHAHSLEHEHVHLHSHTHHEHDHYNQDHQHVHADHNEHNHHHHDDDHHHEEHHHHEHGDHEHHDDEHHEDHHHHHHEDHEEHHHHHEDDHHHHHEDEHHEDHHHEDHEEHHHHHEDDHHHHHHHEDNHHHHHEEHHHEREDHEECSGHSLEGVMVGIWIIVGIFTFLLVEKMIRKITGGHGHSHSAVPPQSKDKHPKKEEKEKEGLRNRKNKGKQGKENKNDNHSHSEDHHHVSKVSGFLNLAADFTHNFTDGLAIGATFVAGEKMGIITTVAILLHEVPHEIGDFAILVHSGFTKWQAMKLQFVTAIGAMIGTVVGLLTGGIESANNVILPITAGGFIYISTVSVIPELLEDCDSMVQTILELLAAASGVGLMTLIALLE